MSVDPRGAIVGILALQGAVEPHAQALAELGAGVLEVRKPAALAEVDRLIIPGGESTTLWRLLRHAELWDPILTRGGAGDLALLGTCAGAILLGREAPDDPPPRLGLVEVTVDRNAYGRQIDSFIGPVEYTSRVGRGEAEGVFIRAPRFRDLAPEVEILAVREGEPVALRQGRIILSTFHPELSEDRRLHRLLLEL